MEKGIKWGIVGPGNIANKFAKAIKNVSGAELVAVASRTEETAKAFAEKHDIPNVFVGYEKMAESDMVDAVYIATPHPFHKPCAEIFLNAKKHVLCEKPVCVNAKQAKELLECAKENGVFMMEAMWTRFLPAIQEALKIVQSGEIGEVKDIKADFCYHSTPNEESKLFQNHMAGGALLDVGVYCLNFADIFMQDAPATIRAMAEIDYDVDCHTYVLMQYQNGAMASLSSAIGVSKPAIGYIYGTKGDITIPGFYGAQELIVNVDNKERRIQKPSMGDGFEEEIAEACNCIRAGKTRSDIMPMAKSIEILEQMDMIREQINLKYPFDV